MTYFTKVFELNVFLLMVLFPGIDLVMEISFKFKIDTISLLETYHKNISSKKGKKRRQPPHLHLSE